MGDLLRHFKFDKFNKLDEVIELINLSWDEYRRDNVDSENRWWEDEIFEEFCEELIDEHCQQDWEIDYVLNGLGIGYLKQAKVL